MGWVMRRAFTLLELLVVVAIIAALLALATGYAMKARREARLLAEHVRLRQLFDANVERRRMAPRYQDEYLRIIERQMKFLRERAR